MVSGVYLRRSVETIKCRSCESRSLGLSRATASNGRSTKMVTRFSATNVRHRAMIKFIRRFICECNLAIPCDSILILTVILAGSGEPIRLRDPSQMKNDGLTYNNNTCTVYR